MIQLDLGPRPVVRTPRDFPLVPYERLTITPLGTTIGAEIEGVHLGDEIDAEMQAEIHQALLEWKVLFFRDQDITQEQHRRFATRWGAAEQHPFYRFVHPDQAAEDVVTLAKDALKGGSENEWHTDITWHAQPSFGAVLRAVEVPSIGGDTLWADAGAAYDGLPQAVRDLIDPLSAVHDWRHSFGAAMPPEALAQLSTVFPLVEHPVVRVHPETGRRTLFVNPIFTTHIVGVDQAESDRLLALLFRQITRPEYQCRFRWTTGSVAFWDNRATQHYASSDYFPERRVMERISIAGDTPFGIAG
ncbi:MAG: TauD/TfdA family dioxygenase [Ilumatobacteraceae bacterium]